MSRYAANGDRVMQGCTASGGSVALLVLLSAGAGIGALVSGAPSAKSQLQAALTATFGASGYESTTNSVPEDVEVVNAPNTSEVLQNGRISQIVVGRKFYWSGWYFDQIFPLGSQCASNAKFVTLKPSSAAYASILVISSRNLSHEEVARSGDVFTVMKRGTALVSYLVQGGYMTRSMFYPSSLPGGVRTPIEVTTYTHIGSAPKIKVPRPSEVSVCGP